MIILTPNPRPVIRDISKDLIRLDNSLTFVPFSLSYPFTEDFAIGDDTIPILGTTMEELSAAAGISYTLTGSALRLDCAGGAATDDSVIRTQFLLQGGHTVHIDVTSGPETISAQGLVINWCGVVLSLYKRPGANWSWWARNYVDTDQSGTLGGATTLRVKLGRVPNTNQNIVLQTPAGSGPNILAYNDTTPPHYTADTYVIFGLRGHAADTDPFSYTLDTLTVVDAYGGIDWNGAGYWE